MFGIDCLSAKSETGASWFAAMGIGLVWDGFFNKIPKPQKPAQLFSEIVSHNTP